MGSIASLLASLVTGFNNKFSSKFNNMSNNRFINIKFINIKFSNKSTRISLHNSCSNFLDLSSTSINIDYG